MSIWQRHRFPQRMRLWFCKGVQENAACVFTVTMRKRMPSISNFAMGWDGVKSEAGQGRCLGEITYIFDGGFCWQKKSEPRSLAEPYPVIKRVLLVLSMCVLESWGSHFFWSLTLQLPRSTNVWGICFRHSPTRKTTSDVELPKCLSWYHYIGKNWLGRCHIPARMTKPFCSVSKTSEQPCFVE
jgi:hypothetical protein